MEFLEDPAFPQCPSYGYQASPGYEVRVVRMESGVERRNRLWSRPLLRFDITLHARFEADVYEALNFYHAAGGMECGFRFMDPSDCLSCAIGGTPAATDQPLLPLGESPQVYQLTKRYVVGARVQDRDILKPRAGILLADAGVAKAEGVDYTVDYTKGQVSLGFVPAGALTWGGSFDVPVRFDSPFPVQIIDKQIQSVSFSLTELRNP